MPIFYYSPDSFEHKESIDNMLQELISLTKAHKQCELKNRRDVLNKSILRAVKRQIVSEFRSYHVYKQFKARNKVLDHFKDSLNWFTRVFINTNNFFQRHTTCLAISLIIENLQKLWIETMNLSMKILQCLLQSSTIDELTIHTRSLNI